MSDISLCSRAAADIRRAQDTRPGPAWSHMQFCTLFAEFQSQVGKILILAINIPPRLAGRRMLAAGGAAALRLGLRRGPDFLTCHVTRVASAAATHSVFLQAGRGKSRKHVTWARYGQEKTANLKSIHTRSLGKLLTSSSRSEGAGPCPECPGRVGTGARWRLSESVPCSSQQPD